jgi:hypothetical protein
MGAYVAVHFKKRGATGVNIYGRRKGEAEFRLLAYRTRSPFKDPTPVAHEGVPEVREYKLVGVLNDEPIGQFTNVATVVFAGRYEIA